ncbi:MAG: methyl-accepting chemotaxis protein [Gammaproteobacteria bacterium]
MGWFTNLKISGKLAVAFGSMLLFTLLLGLISISRLGEMAAHGDEIATGWTMALDQLHDINSATSDAYIGAQRMITASTPEDLASYETKTRAALDLIEKSRPLYEMTITRDKERALFTSYASEYKKYLQFHSNLMQLVGEKKTQDAQKLVDTQGVQAYDNVGSAMDRLIAFHDAGAAAATASAKATYSSARLLIIAVLIGCMLVGVFVSIAVGRIISKPLLGVIEVFKRISAGNLDNAIDTAGRDEIAVVRQSLSEVQSSLRKLIFESREQLTAIDKVQAVIEFQLDGTIVTANANFLAAVGYTIDEVKGRHHSLFVEAAYQGSEDYRRFWEKLRRGEHQRERFLRIGKGGRKVWLDASYNPILGADGKPYKVVKYANDVTVQVELNQQMEAAVAQTQKVIKAATEGDLSVRLVAQSMTGDLRVMGESINALLTSMSDIVSRAKAAASEVHRGAEEISQGNANLSQRTEEQASSLEQTASSMEEMTSSVKQNADSAGQANQLAIAARDQAESGGAVTGRAVKAMTEINQSSRKIADIIGVIDEIAFQTNLLALNAAVEAARAGEQGRGFAVVAQEVRSLAGRSATAAKEIKSLIQDSVRKVEDGSVLVTQSGQTLEQIVAAIKKVSDIVAEIAAASREQYSGIEQVNKAVMQMDEMTQQNAALVEEATAASHSMADQARTLNQMMAGYRVDGAQQLDVAASASIPGRLAPSPVASIQKAEQRGSARPWSSKGVRAVPTGRASPAVEAIVPKRANASAADSDWQEF